MNPIEEKISDEPVLRRIMFLLEQQGKNDKRLLEHLHLANGAFTKWKYSGGKSYFKHIKEIASFLNVTPGYLLHGDEDVTYGSLTGQELKLVQQYRKLDTNGQNIIMDTIDRFINH